MMISETTNNLINWIDQSYLITEIYNAIMCIKSSKFGVVMLTIASLYALIKAMLYIKYKIICIKYKSISIKNIQANKSEQLKINIDQKYDLMLSNFSEDKLIDYLNEIEKLSTYILSGVIDRNESIELYKNLFIGLKESKNLHKYLYKDSGFEETKKIIKILKRRVIIRKIFFFFK